MSLLALCALCAIGCLSTGSEPTGPGGPGPAPDDTTGQGDETPEAYFILQGTDLRSAAWPESFADYALFVCNPSLSALELAQIRSGAPGAVLLAYTNLQDSPVTMYPESPYFQALEAVFDTTDCMIDLDTGNVVRQQGRTSEPGSGYPHWVPRDETIEALVAFHRDVTLAAGWDGFYLDQSTRVYPPWRRAMLDSLTPNFDFDGDGVRDSYEKLETLYPPGRAAFTRRLREEIGDSRILVANSGGALGDANLNGITLEGVGDRFTLEQARGYVEEQRGVSRAPFTTVLWATTLASQVPSRALAVELDVVYGVIGAN